MLPQQYRLNPKEIPHIARKGQKTETELFFVRFLADSTLKHPQFAISISVKTAKNATERNRIKRMLRAIIRQGISTNKFKPGKYLIVVKPAAQGADFQALSAIISSL